MNKKYLWPHELGREVGVASSTVRRLADAGELPYVRDVQQEEKSLTEIKSLAPLCIDDFKGELSQLEIEARNNVRTNVRETKKNFLTDSFGHRFETNVKSVERRLEAIRVARKQAEEFKLKPLSESEILAQLEKLKVELPSAEEFEVTVVPVPDATELRRAG